MEQSFKANLYCPGLKLSVHPPTTESNFYLTYNTAACSRFANRAKIENMPTIQPEEWEGDLRSWNLSVCCGDTEQNDWATDSGWEN